MEKSSRKFDPTKSDFLDSKERKSILNINTILEHCEIKKGWVIADIGCGSGFFSFPLAKIVGETGHVYGIDMEPIMIKKLEDRIAENGVKNISPILSFEGEIPLPNGIADLTLMSLVLHELEGMETLYEIKRIMKSTGLFCIIDWKKIDEPIGPPMDHRLNEKEAMVLLKKVGIHPERPIIVGPSHYLIRARRR